MSKELIEMLSRAVRMAARESGGRRDAVNVLADYYEDAGDAESARVARFAVDDRLGEDYEGPTCSQDWAVIREVNHLLAKASPLGTGVTLLEQFSPLLDSRDDYLFAAVGLRGLISGKWGREYPRGLAVHVLKSGTHLREAWWRAIGFRVEDRFYAYTPRFEVEFGGVGDYPLDRIPVPNLSDNATEDALAAYQKKHGVRLPRDVRHDFPNFSCYVDGVEVGGG